MKLSIVIPCYNSANTIENVIKDLVTELENLENWENEIILVNDCSKDKTIDKLKAIACKYRNITVIDLVKNVGQHSAMLAGFRYATGDVICTADDDGQTPLENIMKLMDKLDEGFDVVCAKYKERVQPSLGRRFGTKMSRFMMNWLIDKPKGIRLSTFFVARNFVIKEMIKYDQPYPFVIGLIARVTSNIANVDMDQKGRASGSSGYNFKKLLHLWLNGFTAFSIKPLRMASFIGFFCSILGVLSGVIIIIRKLLDSSMMVGWSSVISVILIMSGIIMCLLGLIGEYLGRIYMCINVTPQYVIREVIKGKNNEGI